MTATVTCSYTKKEPFTIFIKGQQGNLEIILPPDGSRSFKVYLNNRKPEIFEQKDDPLVTQAQAFLEAIKQNEIQVEADESARKEQSPSRQPPHLFYKDAQKDNLQVGTVAAPALP